MKLYFTRKITVLVTVFDQNFSPLMKTLVEGNANENLLSDKS